MAVRAKTGFKQDPIIWARPCAGVPGLGEMPAHQAKEGALLMLEAGVQPFPGLLKLAGGFSRFTMDDALDLSAKDLARQEAIKAAAERQRRVSAGTLKVIEPQAKVDPAIDGDAKRRAEERFKQRERLALSRYPVKRVDGLGAALLLVLFEQGGRGQFTSSFFASAGFDDVSVANMATTARRLAEQGALTCVSRGHARVASTWELTQLGRQNARAIQILKEDGNARTA